MSRDNRTNEEKQLSPHFSHFVRTGNRVQKALNIGPQEARFNQYSPGELESAAVYGTDYFELEPSRPIMVPDGSGGMKSIVYQEWLKNYFDESRDQGLEKLYSQCTWAYRCVQVKALALGGMPWVLTDLKGNVVEDSEAEHRLREFNPDTNWVDSITAVKADLEIYGKGFIRKVRSDDEGSQGKLLFFQRINPQGMTIKAGPGGIDKFVRKIGAVNEEYERNEIVFFHGYDPGNDFDGVSPLHASRTPIQVDIEANAHLYNFFKNGASPQRIFSLDSTDKAAIERVARAWARKYSGSDKAHKDAFVGGGAKPEQLGYAPKDLALKEVREETRRQICSAFGVPPTLAGAWEAANYATAQASRKSLMVETILPESEYFMGVINAEIMPFLDPTLLFRYEKDKLSVMQEDENLKAVRLSLLVETGIIKADVAAREMDFEDDDVPELHPVIVPVPGEEDAKSSKDLRLWKRKALRQMASKGNADFDFSSDTIPVSIADGLRAQLALTETAEEVKIVFNGANRA